MMPAEEWVRTGQAREPNGDTSRRIDAGIGSGGPWEDVLSELLSSGREAGVTMPLVSDD